MNIAIIVGTTREGRVTPRLARWVLNAAEKHPEAQFNLLDLKDFDIPMLEQAPWWEGRQLNEGTKLWLEGLGRADGIIIVTAEYNHTIPAVLKNAFDHTNGEVVRKPVAIVSHGSVHGVRANEHLRQMVGSNMGAFPISATVPFHGIVPEVLDENGVVTADNPLNEAKLDTLLRDIVWYTRAIKTAKEHDERTD